MVPQPFIFPQTEKNTTTTMEVESSGAFSWEDTEENRCFGNGGTNLHIHAIAQGRPEDNQVEFHQGPHGIVNPPKKRVLKGALYSIWCGANRLGDSFILWCE